MNKYSVILSPRVQKSIRGVPDAYVSKIHKALASLSDNPRPFGCLKLSGIENLYRIRVGVYRVVYSIEDDILVVEVIKIDHRRDVYK